MLKGMTKHEDIHQNNIFLGFLILTLLLPHNNSPSVSRLGDITLGIGYTSQSLLFRESERILTTTLDISTKLTGYQFKAGTCAKYTKEENS